MNVGRTPLYKSATYKIVLFLVYLLALSGSPKAANIEHQLTKKEVEDFLNKNNFAKTTVLFKYADLHEGESGVGIYFLDNRRTLIFGMGLLSWRMEGQYEVSQTGVIRFVLKECSHLDIKNCTMTDMKIFQKGGKYYMVAALATTESRSDLVYKQVTTPPDEYYFCQVRHVALTKVRDVWPLRYRYLPTYSKPPYMNWIFASGKNDELIAVRYEVVESFKGDSTKYGIVYTIAANNAECGVELKAGSDALLEINENGFFPNCGNTKLNLHGWSLGGILTGYRAMKESYLRNPKRFCDAVNKQARQTGFLD